MLGSWEEVGRALSRQEPEELASWLIDVLRGRETPPLAILAEPSVELRLAEIFYRASESVQRKLGAAVFDAMAEWRAMVDEPGLLEQLATLAAYLRLPAVIPMLLRLIVEERLGGSKAGGRAVQVAAAVIAGFAPHPAAEAAMQRLYWRDDCESAAATLMLGLCWSHPEKLRRYLPRFVALTRKRPGEFRVDVVFRELARVVGVESLARRLRGVDADTIDTLISEIASHPRMGVRMEGGTLWMTDERGEDRVIMQRRGRRRVHRRRR